MGRLNELLGDYTLAHCWIEINLDHIHSNYQAVRSHVDQKVKIMGIVKADAYGHGAYPVASQLVEHGVDYLGVALPEEAVRLRQEGIKIPILSLSPALDSWYPIMSEYEITPNITSIEAAEKFARTVANSRKPYPIHVEIDTGMGRYGLDPTTAVAEIRSIARIESLQIEGVFTHFAAASDSSEFTNRQMGIFNTIIDELGNELQIPLIHAANSAATILYPETHLSMVRVGSLLYGNDITHSGKVKLMRAWVMKSRLLGVKDLPAGANIGYGHDARLKTKTKVGVIPVGFTDGLLVRTIERPYTLREAMKLALRNFAFYFGMDRVQEYVLFRGQKAPVLGRVGMQHLCIDLTHFTDPTPGEEVSMSARKAGINPTIPKIYIWKDQPFPAVPVLRRSEESVQRTEADDSNLEEVSANNANHSNSD